MALQGIALAKLGEDGQRSGNAPLCYGVQRKGESKRRGGVAKDCVAVQVDGRAKRITAHQGIGEAQLCEALALLSFAQPREGKA